MHYIGIDLAWTCANESGICVIDDKGKIVYCESKVFTDETIAAIVEEHAQEGAIVGIDAPLIVNNETGSRSCDGAIMREKIHGKNLSVFNCSRGFMLKHSTTHQAFKLCQRGRLRTLRTSWMLFCVLTPPTGLPIIRGRSLVMIRMGSLRFQ